ncbi:MAG: glutaredoxin domain-containing protein [Nannocystaceae bacterium]
MPRPLLDSAQIHAAIGNMVGRHHDELLDEVIGAVARHDVVVVGMKQNPFPRKARKLLEDRGTPCQYLEYGGYFSMWRPRTTLKMWTGWPTFPMVFVKGTLIGGFKELVHLIESGELDTLLAGREVDVLDGS